MRTVSEIASTPDPLVSHETPRPLDAAARRSVAAPRPSLVTLPHDPDSFVPLHLARNKGDQIKQRRGHNSGSLKTASSASCRTPWLAGGQLDPPVSSLQAFAQTAELPDGMLNLNWKLPRQPRQGCCPGRRGRALWASAGCLAEYCYNTSFHSALRATPFKVVYGRPPPPLLAHRTGSARTEAVDVLLHDRDEVLAEIRERLLQVQ